MKILNPTWKQEDGTKCWTFLLTSFLVNKNKATNNFLTTTIAPYVQNKKVYTCIMLQESWSKACYFSDIDECARNRSCHVNANCTNTIGSHVCTCHTGYTGDGQTCSGDFNKFPSMFGKSFMTEEGQPSLLLFYTYNPSYSKWRVI